MFWGNLVHFYSFLKTFYLLGMSLDKLHSGAMVCTVLRLIQTQPSIYFDF